MSGLLLFLVVAMGLLLIFAVATAHDHLQQIPQPATQWRDCEIKRRSVVSAAYEDGYTSGELFRLADDAYWNDLHTYRLLVETAQAVAIAEQFAVLVDRAVQERKSVRAVVRITGVGVMA